MKRTLLLISLITLTTSCQVKKPLRLIPIPETRIQAELPLVKEQDDFPINLANFSYDNSPEIKRALKKYSETGKAPIVKRAGFVQYPYGEVQPILNCQTNYGCDIELQAGEEVQAVILGNSPLWDYMIWESNQEQEPIPHVTIAPRVPSSKTNAIIGTNRRTYHLELISTKESDYVRSAKYYYPRERLENYRSKKRKNLAYKKLEEKNTRYQGLITSGKLPHEYLNFAWKIKAQKKISWKPERVFDDSRHIYIQFSDKTEFQDFPGIYKRTKDKKLSQVTWRIEEAKFSENKQTYLIVDGIFKELRLIGGFNGEDEIIIKKAY